MCDKYMDDQTVIIAVYSLLIATAIDQLVILQTAGYNCLTSIPTASQYSCSIVHLAHSSAVPQCKFSIEFSTPWICAVFTLLVPAS